MNEFASRKLARLRAAFDDGNHLPALRAVVKLCGEFQIALPDWAQRAVLALIAGKMPTGRGRTGNPEAKAKQNRIHYARWDAVRELRDRKDELADVLKPTWEAAYENASIALRGTEAQGEPEAIAVSYKIVQSLFRAGKGARFHHTG